MLILVSISEEMFVVVCSSGFVGRCGSVVVSHLSARRCPSLGVGLQLDRGTPPLACARATRHQQQQPLRTLPA